MGVIRRITLFKLAGEDKQEQLKQAYEVLRKDEKKVITQQRYIDEVVLHVIWYRVANLQPCFSVLGRSSIHHWIECWSNN